MVSLISIGGIHYVCKKKDDADHSRDGFDACLMNTVELNLAVNGYTDCYVASAQTEPGMGQDYTLYGMDGSRIPENVGTHEIMIYGIGDFAGKRSVEYKISPKGTSVRSVKKAKKVRKAVTVKWKMQKDKMSKLRITGYKIQQDPYIQDDQ